MDENRSSMKSASDKKSFTPLKVNCASFLPRIFLSKDTVKFLFSRYMNRILKWLLFIVLAEIAYVSVVIAVNPNRRERLRQSFLGEAPTYDLNRK